MAIPATAMTARQRWLSRAVTPSEHRWMDDDWDVDPTRPTWVRWVAWIAALALLLPLAVAAVDALVS